MLHQPTLSISVARNGHIIIMQGHYRPAFLLLRDAVPRFLASGDPREGFSIPPFASSALACYLIDTEIDSIRLSSALGLPRHPGVLFRLRSRLIAYAPGPAQDENVFALFKAGISILITPRVMASVDMSGDEPSLTVLAYIAPPELPPEQPSFFFPMETIRNAVAEAVAHSKNLIYEN